MSEPLLQRATLAAELKEDALHVRMATVPWGGLSAMPTVAASVCTNGGFCFRLGTCLRCKRGLPALRLASPKLGAPVTAEVGTVDRSPT